jgi:hypothetical protein
MPGRDDRRGMPLISAATTAAQTTGRRPLSHANLPAPPPGRSSVHRVASGELAESPQTRPARAEPSEYGINCCFVRSSWVVSTAPWRCGRASVNFSVPTASICQQLFESARRPHCQQRSRPGSSSQDSDKRSAFEALTCARARTTRMAIDRACETPRKRSNISRES